MNNNNFKIYERDECYNQTNNTYNPDANIDNQKCRLYQFTDPDNAGISYVLINVDNDNNIYTSQVISGILMLPIIEGEGQAVFTSTLLLYNNNNTLQTYVIIPDSNEPMFKITNITNDSITLQTHKGDTANYNININYKNYKECFNYIF